MDVLDEKTNNTRYSAKSSLRPVNFYCHAPEAKVVCLVGDFNQWKPTACRMQRRADGWWFTQLVLAHGHHRYRFLVDGNPVLDPQAMGIGHDPDNQPASVVAVS